CQGRGPKGRLRRQAGLLQVRGGHRFTCGAKHCRSWLAGEEALEDAFAGKPGSYKGMSLPDTKKPADLTGSAGFFAGA
ncbi:hypothetical protein SOP85_21260, partial [Pseudomonas sp. YuFO20]|uniref:hypothetical protein n=1 Tax=Pseudomonas sp. YuFO20 TaxID=3095362 RepID=UPI002B24D926